MKGSARGGPPPERKRFSDPVGALILPPNSSPSKTGFSRVRHKDYCAQSRAAIAPGDSCDNPPPNCGNFASTSAGEDSLGLAVPTDVGPILGASRGVGHCHATTTAVAEYDTDGLVGDGATSTCTKSGRSHSRNRVSGVFFEYVADRGHGQGPAGSMLPSTSARYLHPVMKLHANLGVDLSFMKPIAKLREEGRETFLRRTAGARIKRRKAGLHARCSKRCSRRTGPTRATPKCKRWQKQRPWQPYK